MFEVSWTIDNLNRTMKMLMKYHTDYLLNL
jgi:hypothetical protein